MDTKNLILPVNKTLLRTVVFPIIFPRMNRLTRQEQLFLCVVLGLLLTGWVVKAYRTAHPPTAAIQSAKP
ncbi:MAG TPA: hypothetical protein VHG89_10205 [Verrucomicrobiae bacterium]|nr:hypothetical protein [Verrucomicrobiae bacterium]